MSLRSRLILSYILIIVICLSIVAVALLALSQNFRDRLARVRLNDIAAPILVQVKSLARGQAPLSLVWANLKEQAQETRTTIFLVDGEGNLLRQISPQESSWAYPARMPQRRLPTGNAEPQYGTYRNKAGKSFVYIAYSLTGLFRTRSDTVPETMVIAIPRGEAVALWAYFAKPLVWAGLIALGLSIAIAVLLARSVYLPIRRITTATEEIARGKYEQEVAVAGPKEVQGLALSFNQMAEQVKHSQQLLRDFVADVSHELRSPLTSIKGFALAILDGTARDKQAKLKAASIIEDEAKRMMRLVNDLLELSRLESRQVSMDRELVDVKELLQQCQEIFILQAEEKSIHLTADVGPIPPVIGDIDRLEQVFCNLLDNAVKHTPPGGKVNLSARQNDPGHIEVMVADTGPGIAPEQLSHVFERFYRAEGSEAKLGTGLGLAIAREIVRSHSGNISVTSSAGEGTVFIVKLPISDISSL